MATSSKCRHAVKRYFQSPSITRLTGAAAGASLVLIHKFATDTSRTIEPTHLEGTATFGENGASPLVVHYDCPQPAGSVEYVRQAVLDSLKSNCDWMSEQRLALMDTLQRILADAIKTAEDLSGIDSSNSPDMDESSKSRAQFSTLLVHDVNDEEGSCNEFELNSQTGIPLENDLFDGNMLLILRPVQPEDDPHYNQQDGTRFEIRIQGRLKYVPKGQLYCGGEISDQMNLNRVSKGLSNLLLGVLSRIIGSNMDYSFGERNKLPHISFPLWTAMDHIVVTKPGDAPPDIKESLQEYDSEMSIHSRKEGGVAANWNLDDTYSMSFSASCIDLPTWRIVNPYEVNLSNFWGNSLLRLIVYEKGDTRNDQHATNKYLLALQLKFLGVSSMDNCVEEKGTFEQVSLPAMERRTALTHHS